MDEDKPVAKSLEVLSQDDLIDELYHLSVPENARQAVAEKLADVVELAKTLGAEPQALVETVSTPSTAIVISSEVAANTDQSFRKVLIRGPSAPVGPLSTIRPALKDLVCYAVPRIAAAWYDVGLQLDLEPDVLDEIEKEKSDQPRRMFAKWLQRASCSWQSVLDAVEKTRGAKPMEDIHADVVESIRKAQSTEAHFETVDPLPKPELPQKRRRSSTRSSEDLEPQQSAAKKCLHDYMEIKMDLLARDLSDLQSESDPEVIIKLLYDNALSTISDLLEPHLKAVKKAAGRFHQLGLHQGAMEEGMLGCADSIHSLLSQMSVTGMWNKTRFLRKAVSSIPRSAPERGVAEAILSHYHLHLAIYERATPLKDALAKESKSDEERLAPVEDTKLVPLKITSLKAFGSFTCEDCHRLQARILNTTFGIPDEKIICHNVEQYQSTTVTFLVPIHYTNVILQRCTQLDTVWILLEVNIIELSIPGVFTFSPSVGCFLTLLRGNKVFTANLLGVTEVLPYQAYTLLDSNTKEPLSGRPLNTKMIEQHWDSHDEIGSRPQCSVPESEDDVILVMHSDDATVSMEGTGEADEMEFRVSELEAKVKDLERKVADLFMDNVALKTKLEASRKIEKEQQEEITSLKERLVQALRAQETTTHKQSLSKTRESQLEAKIEMLEATKSDLEKELEKLHKQVMELVEIESSDIGLLEEPSVTAHLVSKHSEVVPTTPSQKEEGQYEFTAQQEPNMEYQEALTERTDKVTEESGEGSTGSTSAVPDQLTGVPTAATRGSLSPTQVVPLSPVVIAAKAGRLSAMRKLLDGGAGTVEDQEQNEMTALLWASVRGHLPVVRELVDVYKVNVFQKNKFGHNAMHMAAAGGQLEVIKFLSPVFGARVHEKDSYGFTMLHWAAQEGHCEVARYLIEELKMDPQDKDKWGNTALLRSAYGGSVDLVRMLLDEFHCSLDEVNTDGRNAMHKAAEGGQLEVIKFLSPMFGARVHEKTTEGSYTMLHWAAQDGHCEVARYLIEELKMNPQDRDKWGTTALLKAAFGGNVNLVRMLLEEFDCSLDEVNTYGQNAMHVAAHCGQLEVIKFLSPKFGARVHKKDNDGYSMLHWAANDGHCEVARYLIEELKMDPQDRYKYGHNALHLAALFGHLEMVKYLLPILGEKKFDVNSRGHTCLTLAIEEQKEDVVEYLLQHGGFTN